jgi:hypothetical protein
MTRAGGLVTGGVDEHTDTHDAAALDERGAPARRPDLRYHT